MNISNNNSGFVYDVTDAPCWAQNVSVHGLYFYDFQISIFSQQDQKSNENYFAPM